MNSEPYIFPTVVEKPKVNQFTIGEMYCGPGGIALAAKKSKLIVKGKKYCFEHVWATDNHRDTCMTFQTNIPTKRNKDFKVICDDIGESLVTIISDNLFFKSEKFFPSNSFNVSVIF